jgi:four helix bundle protein
MRNENILTSKSFHFALRIIKLYKFLTQEKKEYILSKQVLRSGTAIGALISEAEFARSKADFINKMYVSLKEANETRYWLRLLHQSDYITNEMFNSILPDIETLIKLLVSSTKTAKQNHAK